LSEHPNKQTDDYRNIFELYFSVSRFLTLYDNRSDAHHLFYDPAEDCLKLFCSDAQEFLRARLKKGQSGIFFSATLTPLSYHCELLGGDREDYLLDVPGIFDPSHFMILCDVAVKTSYRQRESYYPIIAQHIHAIVQSRICNKFVFFPSYEFLLKVREEYEKRYDDSLLVQKRYMNESERSAFLAEFEEAIGITAFAVAGGVFSEGIDLVGERLGGVIVCGVSLPKVCMERELIRAHFDAEEKNGFDYAYLIPGMNKVLQSMGRVIRTESDIGYAVLMDERFSFASYRNCLPPHYDQITTVRTELDLIGELKKETEEHG
jgi:Rad3-related DNA helicase